MKPRFIAIVGVILLSCFSLIAINQELDQADNYFNDRKNINSLKQAKKLYEKIIIKSKNNDEKIHAFDRFARLSFLEGQIAPYVWGIPAKNTSQIFERCIDLSTKVNKDALGYDVPEYAYWRAMCIGLWANNSSVVSLTFKSTIIFEMINLIKTGMQKYPDFDDGGFYLLQAGLKIRSSFLKIIKAYDPEGAILLLNETQQQGYDNFSSYLLKAEAQAALSQTTEAKNTLQEGINKLEAKIADQSINYVLKVEDQATLYLLKESFKTLNFGRYELNKIQYKN